MDLKRYVLDYLQTPDSLGLKYPLPEGIEINIMVITVLKWRQLGSLTVCRSHVACTQVTWTRGPLHRTEFRFPKIALELRGPAGAGTIQTYSLRFISFIP